jgi:hypothetical protein
MTDGQWAREWASNPRVIVVCPLCPDRPKLAQVEVHDGQLYWHARGHQRIPADKREGRRDAKWQAFVLLDSIDAEVPSAGFTVICQDHPANVGVAATDDLKSRVRAAVLDWRGKPIVVEFTDYEELPL